MRPSISVRILSYILGTMSLRKIILSLLFCVILLGWVLTPSAEIYRWQDREGVIRYSNTPPEDQSLVIEAIPTERIPLLEDENGMIYYLHVPEGSSTQNPSSQQVPGQLALPPEVLDRLVHEASQTIPPIAKEPSPDLTALTIRLAELERSLKQEMNNRQQWEQEYRQTQSYTKELEQQNERLKLAVAQMQTKFEQLQQTVDASKAYVAALQRPDQEFVVIETKMAQLQTSVTDMSQHSKQAAEQVHTQVNALYARLENVETDIQALRNPPVTEQVSVSTLSQKLEELKGQLPQPQQFDVLSQKFARLESKLDSLDLEDQLSTISGKLHTLESQNMAVQDVQTRLASLETTLESVEEIQHHPDQEFQGKLASLETNIATLREMIPAPQRSHEIVEKLLDNGSILKNVVAYQSEQLDAQKTQIARLDQELTRLKTTLNPDVPVKAMAELPSDLKSDELIALLEKQHVMETVIKHQANALMVQKERLDELETLLKQAQNKGMSAISRVDEQDVVIFEEQTSGRIMVVPRKERRTEPEISLLDLLEKSFH
ncbi:chromosome segregation ATPases [Candidatus Vecturithrix granuli]|uniref:Chromosome segregation ATPases n=1 Tax=Vecturithrix granuli TaxID=1499967 RepID=A0A081C277_VECG1|nr:chromosome segregation ATPases [Candidatus Vecturithrix granuli]